MSFNRLALLLLLSPAPSFASGCGAEEGALRDMKLRVWPGLYRAQDTEGLRRFLSPDYRSIDADGEVSTRDEEIAWLSRNRWTPSDFRYDISSVSCPTPNVAVIIGEGRTRRVQSDAPVTVHVYTSSNVFVREEGRWRAALSHISGQRVEPERR